MLYSETLLIWPDGYPRPELPTVYVSEFLSFKGLGRPGVCSKRMLGFS